jgi:hypothetical protein
MLVQFQVPFRYQRLKPRSSWVQTCQTLGLAKGAKRATSVWPETATKTALRACVGVSTGGTGRAKLHIPTAKYGGTGSVADALAETMLIPRVTQACRVLLAIAMRRRSRHCFANVRTDRTLCIAILS